MVHTVRHVCFFAPEKVGGRGHTPGQFVTSPFTTYRSQKVLLHGNLDYHLNSMAKMDEFIARFKQQLEVVSTQLDQKSKEIVEHNLQVVESLIKVILLCGKQGLALRGHSDDRFDYDDTNERNMGNFLECVRFRAETDDVLRKHLMNAPRNAQYTSKTIQNELISVIGNHIRSDILDEVRAAKIIADEVTDVSNKEQLSLSLR